LPDRLQHARKVFHHIRVPEPDDTIAMLCELCRARVIGSGLRVMLASIKLDHQLPFRACKVGDATSDGVLTAESPRELVFAQCTPKPTLDIRRIAAKLPRNQSSRPKGLSHPDHPPHPNPSPP
jgi:hypothetical protein